MDGIKSTHPNQIEIVNVIDDLAVHPRRKYPERDVTKIEGIVIHHTTGSNISPGTTAQAIARFHVNIRHWAGIGYHYFIDTDGAVLQCQRTETMSNHCGNPNRVTLGVVLRGDFTRLLPTPAQISSLTLLLAHIQGGLDIHTIAGHGRYPGATATACPGKTWRQWLTQCIRDSMQAPTPPHPASVWMYTTTWCFVYSKPVAHEDYELDELAPNVTINIKDIKVWHPGDVWVLHDEGWSPLFYGGKTVLRGVQEDKPNG